MVSLEELSKKIKVNFRPELIGIMERIMRFYIHSQNRELIIPKNPLEQAVYFLVYPIGESFEGGSLYRTIEFGQPLAILRADIKYDYNKILKEMIKAYNKFGKKEKITLTIPESALYKKNFAIKLIRPENNFDLAEEFENILNKYNVIEVLENRGKEVLERMLARF